jgi:PKD repeat protein
MRALLVIFLFILTSNTFAGGTDVNKNSDKERAVSVTREKIELDLQEKFKSAFEIKRKKAANSNSQIAQNMNNTAPVREDACAAKLKEWGKNLHCSLQAKTISLKQSYYQSKNRISKVLMVGQARLASFFNKIQNKFKSFLRSKGMRTNQPPYAGDIYYSRSSDGAAPLYYIGTDLEMEDSDGQITHVIYDFGDGSSMTIPAHELDIYASVDHAFPSTGTYTVSLKIYDDQNDYTEYTKSVLVNDAAMPLNNFSHSVVSGNELEFVGTTNTPESSIIRYRWNFGDGTGNFTGTSLNTTTHTFANPGAYQVNFYAWDNKDARARVTRTIYVGQSVPSDAAPTPIVRMDNIFGEGPLTVAFDASFSVDYYNTPITNFEWNFGDFDSVSNYSISATPSHTYKHPGTYYGYVKTTDTAQNTQNYYFRVFVSSDIATDPQIVAYQTYNQREIAFDGSNWALIGTVDNYKYKWNFGDGTSATGIDHLHTYNDEDTYTVQLVGHDVRGIRHVVNKTIDVTNDMDVPEINLSYFTFYDQSYEVHFTASGSYDPQQSEDLIYTWNLGDGTVLTGTQYENVNHTYTQVGFYPVRLTVTNTRGLSKSQFTTVTIQEGSQLKSEISFNPKSGVRPLTVFFDSNLSTSTTGNIIKSVWQFGDSTGVDQSSVSRTFNTAGIHWVRLYILDDEGNEAVNYKEVTVFEAEHIPANNQAPQAAFTATTNDPNGAHFTLDATSSTDADGVIKYYEWVVDNNPKPDGQILQHSFTPGTHTVQLTVSDVWGARNSTTKEFKTGASNVPVFDFDYSPQYPIENTVTYFELDEGTLIPGLPLNQYYYSWNFGDGSSPESGEAVQHTYTQTGTYTVSVTVPGPNGFPLIKTKTVVVGEVSNPVVSLKIKDEGNSQEILDEETYTGFLFPDSLLFSTNSSKSQSLIVDADWDFGDGNTGFGVNAKHTYHKPGTYNVTVTGFNQDGLSDTSSATVVIPEANSCPSLEGSDVCLRLNTAQGNVLPMSESAWVVSHSDGEVDISDDTEDTPEGWIKLVLHDSIEEEMEDIDLSDIVTINGDEVEISKSGLLAKSIDLTKPYKLVMNAVSTSDEPLVGDMPKFYFGVGTLAITTTEEDVRLIISQADAQFKKYIKLASSTSVNVSNLPLGAYTVEAQKGDRSDVYSISVPSSTTVNLAVDLDPEVLKRRFNKKTNLLKKDKDLIFKNFQDEQMDLHRKHAIQPRQANASVQQRTLPSWTDGLCGQEAPFPAAVARVPQEGENLQYFFDSQEPMNNSAFVKIPSSIRTPIQLRCGVNSKSLLASWMYWKLVESGKACSSPPYTIPTDYTNYINTVKETDALKIIIRYKIRDGISGATITKDIVKTATELREAEGLSYSTVTSKKGLWVDPIPVQDYAYQFNTFLEVPEFFRKPEMSFELYAPNNNGNDNWYQQTVCHLFETDPEKDKIVNLFAAKNSSRSVSVENAILSIHPQYQSLPVHYDDRAKGPLGLVTLEGNTIGSNIYKAQYDLLVLKGDSNNSINWDEFKVAMKYSNQTPKSWTYNRSSTPSTTTFTVYDEGKYTRIKFFLDLTTVGTDILWEPGISKVKLEFQGFYNNVAISNKFAKSFTALFDAITENNRHEPTTSNYICSNGFYNLTSAGISAYARDSLLTNLRSISGVASVRCNDMGLPFGGGTFKWPVLLGGKNDNKPSHGNHHGGTADIRYFNDPVEQDNYDQYPSGSKENARFDDIKSYLNFSKKALEIGDETSSDPENDTNALVVKKRGLRDYCNPTGPDNAIPPCTEATGVLDINYSMVLKICQWNYSDSNLVIADLCPDLIPEDLEDYSVWAEESYKGLSNMMDLFGGSIEKILISPGVALANYPKMLNWQKSALSGGEWPRRVTAVAEPIYKKDPVTTHLTNIPVSSTSLEEGCYILKNCPFVKKIGNGGTIHFNHMHLQVKGQ